ncbi:PREDICTED: dual specificity mitogen-activated protein kinase kinase 1-like [Amphimedon queenslandica]|uniref:mitogen-activated protein kinase kinase n=1 Tax=Amphimedon queenslandica TaxID=400682 RepID=A0A1X7VCQ5_AMPQE|nr:PREDICTED: dual specificity mitogen-activated protein kinase kinase 1-like [Amphimedon queenslandica]|eukprot:XP_003384864.1 PREDICTED: dual specificity mitogen-activated protein kinase kinase 1-like [Amphimedon queenslandica]
MAEKRKKPKPSPLSLQSSVETLDSPDGSIPDKVPDPSKPSAAPEPMTEQQALQMKTFLGQKEEFLTHGELKDNQFERLSELGHGNGGVVLKVMHKPSGIIMARKMILLDIKPTVRNQIMRELKVLHDCNASYIVGFFGSFHVNNEISILMQHMDGGSLDLVLNTGRIPVDMIGQITVAVLNGLKYLRDTHHIIHRDVKPSNILVNSEGEIKLCDFGVSGQLINSMANSFVGTRSYMAPERLQGEVYSVLSDIWSLGVSLIEMAIGSYPIPAPPKEQLDEEMRNPPAGSLPPRRNPYASHANAIRMPVFELLQMIFTDDPPRLPDEYFDDKFKSFVALCLQKDVKKRGTLSALLEHKFVEESSKAKVDFASWVKRTIDANALIGTPTSIT